MTFALGEPAAGAACRHRRRPAASDAARGRPGRSPSPAPSPSSASARGAEAERWIEAGRVRVDGQVVRWPARRIDPRRRPGDASTAAASATTPSAWSWRSTSPPGYITSRTDPGGPAHGLRPPRRRRPLGLPGGPPRPRHLRPADPHQRPPAGPAPDRSRATCRRPTTRGARRPVPAKRSPRCARACPSATTRSPTARPASATSARRRGGDVLAGDRPHRGQNRQVRRMCAAVGHDVLELVRVANRRVRAGRPRRPGALGRRLSPAERHWNCLVSSLTGRRRIGRSASTEQPPPSWSLYWSW